MASVGPVGSAVGGAGLAATGGGAGGVGGGGGGGRTPRRGGVAAPGGGPGAGGGGGGAGAAVFVRKGATLNIVTATTFTGDTVQGGQGTFGNPVNAGQGLGTDLFLGGSAALTVSANNSVTLAQALAGGADGQISGGFT